MAKLSIFIHFVDPNSNKVTQKFLALVEVEGSKEAEALFLKIKDVLTVCSYHVTYAFQSESALYSCLNVKELLARSRHEI